MDSYIDKKLDEFCEKDSPRFMDMFIFDEILKRINELENIHPALYFYELKRIRDIKCCIDTAREDGRKQGLQKARENANKIIEKLEYKTD